VVPHQSQLSTPEPPWERLSTTDRYRISVGGFAEHQQRIGVLAPYRRRLIASDSLIVSLAIGLGLLVSSRQSAWEIDPLLAIYGVPLGIGVLWIGCLLAAGSYDRRVIGPGIEEVQRILTATLVTFAVVAGVGYLIRADISRAYAFVSLPLGCLGIALGRFAWRGWLYRMRARGSYLTDTIVIGPPRSAEDLASAIATSTYVGYRPVGVVGLPRGASQAAGWLDEIDGLLSRTGARAIALDPGGKGAQDLVRELAWRLEGRGIDLLISAGMADIAGPRLSMRPIAGLALLHLDEASLSRGQRAVKRCLDLAGGLMALLVLAPLMAVCAIAVRADSPGPAFFRQDRIGRSGRPFTMWKFRSMRIGADQERQVLRRHLGQDSPMFKVDNDPRVTRVGRVLRRWSLDELPQLFNVVAGTMSLVGPRPHPLDDVDRYELQAYRRLALKPGMTGLWQVEGRSELSWKQALQLDLYYVERWSLSTDIVLLARTVRAVILGRGAR
jgi:exopolysaccharide biosynthesis polyprenyl glycosylphosphotransferase